MDNRPMYFAAVQAFLALVDQVGPGDWDRPGLGVWDVRGLVGHTARALTTVRDYLGTPADEVACETAADYFVAALRVATPDVHAGVARRGIAEGQALGEDPPAALLALADEVRGLLEASGNPVITTIAGGIRLQNYLPTRVLELAVHSLDLADALGLEYRFPTQAVELTVALLGQIGVATGRAPEAMRVLTGRGGSAFTVL
ncbi:MAG: maleylpyruvate isomerase N-terminal domain-containing protein [Dermatophilaceae bacterium]